MWVVVILAILVMGFLIVQRSLDKETKKNFSFLLKMGGIALGLIILLVLFTVMTHK